MKGRNLFKRSAFLLLSIENPASVNVCSAFVAASIISGGMSGDAGAAAGAGASSSMKSPS